MEQIQKLLYNIDKSPTQFHAFDRACSILNENGYVKIYERDPWRLAKGGKYYVTRNGSSLIAFEIGESMYFKIVASHTDSPALKIKDNPTSEAAGLSKLNVECYGGMIYHTWLDRQLKIAGRALYSDGQRIDTRILTSDFNVVIPSVAIHLNREVNDGKKLNPQVDLLPVTGASGLDFKNLYGDALSYDFYAVCAEKGYVWGGNNEFISAPRLDDLQGVFSSLEAITNTHADGINVLALLDSEETGSMTRQGAFSTFLSETAERISLALNKTREEYFMALSNSMIISLDNAHAKHPNHPELSDPTNNVILGGGVVIKHSAGGSYTTDGFTCAAIRKLFKENDINYQDFFNRSDMRGGSTLGAISLTQLSIPSVDLGLPQLAMHSAVETAACSDYKVMINALKAFYSSFKL